MQRSHVRPKTRVRRVVVRGIFSSPAQGAPKRSRNVHDGKPELARCAFERQTRRREFCGKSRPRQLDIVREPTNEQVGEYPPGRCRPDPVPLVPRLRVAPVLFPSGIVCGDPAQGLTTSDRRWRGRLAAPRVPLLVQQRVPVVRQPTEQRREIPADVGLTMAVRSAGREADTCRRNLDFAHRPAVTAWSSSKRVGIGNPTNCYFESVRAASTEPATPHRRSRLRGPIYDPSGPLSGDGCDLHPRARCSRSAL